MGETAIKFENISKQYRLGTIGTGTLSHDLKRWWTVSIRGKEDAYLKIGSNSKTGSVGNDEYVWALRDINLEVKQGEVLGIIGKNGAGKSTLLKLLSRVTSPTIGIIKTRGRIASLLEVGTGFHPEMTGRENVFMNGSIMGMTKTEIRMKFDEIVSFAGVEKYIDTPVKRYSSGMTVRLGFAIAAHLDPEILVVDEVLAVGDAEFQKKAVGKMQDVSREEGRTVLFVSHNMNSIKRLCKNGLLLNKGQVEFYGSVNDTINKYLSVFHSSHTVSHIKFESNDKEVQIMEARLTDENGDILKNAVDVKSEFFLNIRYSFKKSISRLHLTFIISNDQGERILFCDRVDYYMNYASVDKGIYETKIGIPNPLLLPGKYSVSLGCQDFDSGVDDHKYDLLSFEISKIESYRILNRDGYIFYPLQWDLRKIDN